MALLFFILTILFQLIGNKSVIDVIYIMASYTYGPLLGMFGFALALAASPDSKAFDRTGSHTFAT